MDTPNYRMQFIADQIKGLINACAVAKAHIRAGERAVNMFERNIVFDADLFFSIPQHDAVLTIQPDSVVQRQPNVTDADFIDGIINLLDAYYLLADRPIDDDHYTVYQAAAYLHVAPITLKKSIERHGTPPHHELGRSRNLLFRRSDLDAWDANRKPPGNPNFSRKPEPRTP